MHYRPSSLLTALLLLLTTAVAAPPATAAAGSGESAAIESLRETGKAFASVARAVSPSVMVTDDGEKRRFVLSTPMTTVSPSDDDSERSP